MDDLFAIGNSIRGIKLTEFLNWAEKSFEYLLPPSDRSSTSFNHPWGLLVLPPIQRTTVWTPKQIVDLWDSLFSGLPIGTFYLVPRTEAGKLSRGFEPGSRMRAVDQGYDLLDGQQRLLTMLLGLVGPKGRDKRCLWVDLPARDQQISIPKLFLTSVSQPFGYTPEGQKLSVENRRKARIAIESHPEKLRFLKVHDDKGGFRRAYNHELFALFLQNAPGGLPPQPYRPADASTYALHHLMKDRNCETLRAALKRFDEAEIALFKVDPNKLGENGLLRLFDRIGQGGTRLSDEERLFSIYKYHEPRVHDVVYEIYDDKNVGRVLPCTKIVTASLRIANAKNHKDFHEGNTIPDVETFAKEMAGKLTDKENNRRRGTIRKQLDELFPMPQNSDDERKAGRFVEAFRQLIELLKYESNNNRLGVPTIMLVRLSPQLIQVLLFWVLNKPKEIEPNRENIIRFVMFWSLCVFNEEKASVLCFEKIRGNTNLDCTRMLELYDLLTETVCAHRLIVPGEMEKCALHPSSELPSSLWYSDQDRFKIGENLPTEIFKAWWNSGDKFLMWLQREYVTRKFADFDPTSGRDDDVPYDLDHICPQKEWGDDWRTFQGWLKPADLDKGDLDQIRWARFSLGNSIGNLRIIDVSINRADGDAPIKEKLFGEREQSTFLEEMRDMAFNPEHKSDWLQASAPTDRSWDKNRLIAFQRAVEKRTAWLYRQFYNELAFDKWNGVSQSTD